MSEEYVKDLSGNPIAQRKWIIRAQKHILKQEKIKQEQEAGVKTMVLANEETSLKKKD